jgi:peptidyl-tRNA hydrolase, PTH1 family
MKIVCGLGNPGPEYEDTRHNVGWWLLEALRAAWRFPTLRRSGPLRASEGRVDGETVLLVAPVTYMNRSGAALTALGRTQEFAPASELLVLVDDVALEPGRCRLRAQGSSGGHNGLKSVEAALRTQEYARLRIGVGAAPAGEDLAEWVLTPFDDAEDEQRVAELLPELVEVVRTWVVEGVEAAARRCNR